MYYFIKLLSLAIAPTLMLSMLLSGQPAPINIAQAEAAEADRSEADRLFQQGQYHLNSSQFGEAIQSWEQALTIYQALGDRPTQANALNGLGNAHHSSGDSAGAIPFYEQALSIRRELGDRSGEANSLSGLGNAHRALAEYGRAIDLYEQSLVIAKEVGDRSTQANALNGLGNAYHASGESARAVDFYEQALTIKQALGDRRGETNTLSGLGNAYRAIGESARAIEQYEQSLAIAKEVGDRSTQSNSLNGLGNAYHALGEHERAIDFYEQALTLKRELGDRQGEANSLNGLGNAYRALGEHDRAIELYEQSLEISTERGDRQREVVSLNGLGSVYYVQEENKRAIDFYEQSLTITRDLADRQGEASSLNGLGNAYRAIGEYAQAMDFYQQSLALSTEIGDRQGKANTLNSQGVVLMDTAQFSKAESILRQSMEIYESLRTNLLDVQLISLMDKQAHTYANLERALTSQNKTTEALTIAERGRARAFVLQLASHLPTSSSAKLANNQIAQPPTIADIQQIARDTDTTLVTYSLIYGSVLYIWVVQPAGDISFREIKLAGANTSELASSSIATIDGPLYRTATDSSELTDLVIAFRSRDAVASTPSSLAQLKALHQILIDPISDLLPTNPEEKVAFIPQGNLFLVPFAALQDGAGTYLIEKHTVLTAPSIQAFGLANGISKERANASASRQSALIVGNPEMPSLWSPESGKRMPLAALPDTETEARAIADLKGQSPLLGKQATEALVKQQLPSANLIHLATHGLLDYGNPRISGIVDFPGAIALTSSSGEDGLLTATEIQSMDLQAHLAVLSACDTGRGRITGDGVVGLSRAFITAGVPSVVVSLWAVPDASTSALMVEFYHQMEQGQDKAQALRQAMLVTMEQHENPRSWAGFALIGAAE